MLYGLRSSSCWRVTVVIDWGISTTGVAVLVPTDTSFATYPWTAPGRVLAPSLFGATVAGWERAAAACAAEGCVPLAFFFGVTFFFCSVVSTTTGGNAV